MKSMNKMEASKDKQKFLCKQAFFVFYAFERLKAKVLCSLESSLMLFNILRIRKPPSN